MALLLVGAALGACTPLSDSAQGIGNCLVAITDDSGSGQILDSNHDAAQSFIVQGSTITVSTVSIKLIVNSTDHVTKPTGSLNLYIYSDNTSSTTLTPSQPSGTALGPANNFGTLDTSTISLTQAQFYTFTLPSAVQLSPAAYWVYVKSGIAQNATVNVIWEQSTSDSYPRGFPFYAGSPLSGFDLLTQIGC